MNFWAAFFLGLAGSLHCAAMCGPLVLALSVKRRGRSWPWIYHSGRLVTYIVLGAMAGAAGSVFLRSGWQRGLSLFGGLMVVGALALQRSRLSSWLKARFATLLTIRSPVATFALGALNGLLPCGLVYLASAAAAATGSLAGGALTMSAFGLGTMPMLLGINFAGRGFSQTTPAVLRRIALTCAGVAGGLLILRGLSLGIPYVSPGPTHLCGAN